MIFVGFFIYRKFAVGLIKLLLVVDGSTFVS
jgi:hypothetical protein